MVTRCYPLLQILSGRQTGQAAELVDEVCLIGVTADFSNTRRAGSANLASCLSLNLMVTHLYPPT